METLDPYRPFMCTIGSRWTSKGMSYVMAFIWWQLCCLCQSFQDLPSFIMDANNWLQILRLYLGLIMDVLLAKDHILVPGGPHSSWLLHRILSRDLFPMHIIILHYAMTVAGALVMWPPKSTSEDLHFDVKHYAQTCGQQELWSHLVGFKMPIWHFQFLLLLHLPKRYYHTLASRTRTCSTYGFFLAFMSCFLRNSLTHQLNAGL